MRWIIVLLLCANGALAQITFHATVDRTSARVGDQVKLMLEVKGAATGVPVPVMPSITGLELAGGPFRSTELQIINGRMAGSTVYTYVLRAAAPGTGKIGSSTLIFKKKRYSTKPIAVQIASSGQPVSGTKTKGKTEDAFVRVHVSKKHVYQNEKTVLTYTIYFRSSITSPEITRMPRTAGFWVEQFQLPRDLPIRTEVINGVQYRAAVFKKMALFPTRTGKLTVEPLVLRTQITVKTNRRDPFGMFNDSFFGRGRSEAREIRSPSATINVKSLPAEGKPENFSGAVGNFKITAALDKNASPAHEAVTLTFKITGEGNIKTLADPKIFFPPDIETYDPKVTDHIGRKDNRVRGSKAFEYLLIPRASGVQRIPPIAYSYFNPKTKTYQQLSTPALVLNVTKGVERDNGSIGFPIATKRGVEQIGEDIAYVKVKSDGFRKHGNAPYESFAFWFALAVPWAAVVMVYSEKRRRDKLGEMSLRNLRAPRQARKGFTRAKRLTEPGKEEAFYTAVAHTLRSYLAARLHRTGNDISLVELEESWNENAWPVEILSDVQRILGECDFTRFASGTLPADRRDKIVHEAEKIVEGIEQLMTSKGRKG